MNRQVGWELLVASVGDSLAYLDTGTEIVVVSDMIQVQRKVGGWVVRG